MGLRIEIDGMGVDLVLSKVTALTLKKEMIHLDQLDDGTWRLIYSKAIIPDITQVEGFKIKRD